MRTRSRPASPNWRRAGSSSSSPLANLEPGCSSKLQPSHNDQGLSQGSPGHLLSQDRERILSVCTRGLREDWDTWDIGALQ